jgi:peptidoglycan hydrolase-like protein with peptidoglycan-binding domain
MALQAPRFSGDVTLEACLRGDHDIAFGETSPAVKTLQEALIDCGFLPPAFAPSSDFDLPTKVAVGAFQAAKGIAADGVVGRQTMDAFDRDFVDKPPAPFRERDEWLAWRNRASFPALGAYDFTRADELARRNASRSFWFDKNSSWLPTVFKDSIIAGITALLDPYGSPSGPGTESGTWGAGVFDFYHCHIMIWTGGVLPIPSAPEIAAGTLSTRIAGLQTATGPPPYDAAWCSAYAARLLSSDVSSLARDAANACLDAATATQPLMLNWHTFEGADRHRPAGMDSRSPRRHWANQVGPVHGPVLPFPYVTPAQTSAVFHEFFEIAFLVAKTGMITAAVNKGPDVFAIAGLSFEEVRLEWF